MKELELRLYHRKKSTQNICDLSVLVSNQSPNNGLLWTTCQREILFVNGEELNSSTDLSDDIEVYRDAEAFEFLLRILCGLESEVFGETEISGQFRKLVADHPDYFSESLQAAIFKMVKSIRSEELKGLGQNSYGSWLRKKITADQVCVIGDGVLAQKIKPWISHKTVRTFTRKNIADLSVEVPILQTLVLAAPMKNADLEKFMTSQKWQQIIDLRSLNTEQGLMSLTNDWCVDKLELNDIFEDFHRFKEQNELLKQRVIRRIHLLVNELVNKSWHRPQSLYDLYG